MIWRRAWWAVLAIGAALIGFLAWIYGRRGASPALVLAQLAERDAAARAALAEAGYHRRRAEAAATEGQRARAEARAEQAEARIDLARAEEAAARDQLDALALEAHVARFNARRASRRRAPGRR